MSKKFVFDLDGTLVNGKQQLNDGVVEFLDNLILEYPDASFTIASGARLNQIEEIIDQINGALLNGKIHFNIISNAGSYIKTKDNTECKVPFDVIDWHDIRLALNHSNPNAMVVYRSRTEDFLRFPKNAVEKVRNEAIKKIAKKYWLEPEYVSEDFIKQRFEAKDIYSVEIISPIMSKQVIEKMKYYSTNKFMRIAPSIATELSNLGKLKALKALYNNDLSGMVYFGDGKNDMEPMKAAELSFALGKKPQVLQSATFAIESFKDANEYFFGKINLQEKSDKIIEEALNKKSPLGKVTKAFKLKKNSEAKYTTKKDLTEKIEETKSEIIIKE